MKLVGEAKLLRIFLGENDKLGKVTVHERIVQLARKENLAGATVYKGILGFGKRSIVHTSKILRLSEDLPIVIEIVDVSNKIESFIPLVEEIFEEADIGGLITIEKAEIIKYTKGKDS